MLTSTPAGSDGEQALQYSPQLAQLVNLAQQTHLNLFCSATIIIGAAVAGVLTVAVRNVQLACPASW
jgi:hypothetical protein